MSSKIDTDRVRQVARLSRIELTDPQLEQFTSQLSDILSYVDQLNELDTDAVEPTSHPLRLGNVFRSDSDKVQPSLSSQQALANAPQTHGQFFAVPKVLE